MKIITSSSSTFLEDRWKLSVFHIVLVLTGTSWLRRSLQNFMLCFEKWLTRIFTDEPQHWHHWPMKWVTCLSGNPGSGYFMWTFFEPTQTVCQQQPRAHPAWSDVWTDDLCLMCTHMNARTQAFSAHYCTVTSSVCGCCGWSVCFCSVCCLQLMS